MMYLKITLSSSNQLSAEVEPFAANFGVFGAMSPYQTIDGFKFT